MGFENKIYTGEKYTFRTSNKRIDFSGNSSLFNVEFINTSMVEACVAKFFVCKKGDIKERYSRFRREIDFLENNRTIHGVLPLIDKHCPKKPPEDDPAWYTMPKADRFQTKTIRSLQEILFRILEQSEAVIKQSFSNRTISEIILFSSVIPVHNKQIILHSRGSKDTAQYRLSSVTMRYFPQSEIIELIPGTPTENRIEGEIYYQQRRDLDPQPGLKKYLLTPNEKIVFSKGGIHESF